MLRTLRGFAILVLIYFAIAHGFPRPEALKPESWRLFALFVATVTGLVLQPIPGGAIVFIGVTMMAVVGGLTVTSALGGYADPTVWLVLVAFFISRALLNTGLARRIALLFIQWFGTTTLGVTYALAASDMTLAAIIPSNSARSGGVTLPLTRSIAELYDSRPGATAGRLGSFLMVAVYQSICVTAAMFFTGQASNPLAAQMAAQQGYTITWSSWLVAGLVPGLVSLAVIPFIVRWMYPPEIHRTPEASAFATAELAKMGPMSAHEKMLAAVFVAVCTAWATSGIHKFDITLTALLGAAALLMTGVLTWHDVRTEHNAWDVFIWYGGMVRMGKALNDSGVTRVFAETAGAWFADFTWPLFFVCTLLIYAYAHYGFASISAHLLSMYPPFLALLVVKGAPIGLVAYAFACFANLSAGLTHYGTTPSPMFFAQEYVSFRDWWRIGAVVVTVNFLIWGTVGFGWWRVLGIF